LEASRWANPFQLSKFPRHACIQKFRDHLANLPFFPSALQELSGKTLGCHCGTDVDCHGDVLMSALKVWLGWSTAAVVSASIPWSPQEFVERALRADHLFCGITCDPHIWASLFRLFTLGRDAFVSSRLDALAFWRNRARQLQELEDSSHTRMHPEVREVVKGKRVELFFEMLSAAEFPQERGAADSMREGFMLVGEVPPTGSFPAFRRPAAISACRP
jgi:hypothetical protein